MKLFISYRRNDSDHAAQRVRLCLQTKFGAEAAFIDRDTPAGEAWQDHLRSMLKDCTGVIVLVGDAFLRELRRGSVKAKEEPDWLAWEIEIALGLDKKIYPVLIGALEMPDASKLPPAIRGFARYQAVFAREPAFDAAMTVLIKSIADQHAWVEPANRPGTAAAGIGSAAGLRGIGLAALPLLAVAALWLVGRLSLWLGDSSAAPVPAEAAIWRGTHYVLATALWGLGPYLAFRGVAELRARARLPIHTVHAVLSVCNLCVVLVVGGTFLLLSTRLGWAIELLWVLPAAPRALHYAAQGAVLLAIVFGALGVALFEPHVRQLQRWKKAWGLQAINTGDVLVMLCGLWFAASLLRSLPALASLDPVPTIGYVMLCPALSLLLAVWDYTRSQLGVGAGAWPVRVLFGLAVGLYIVCTMAYFSHGPARLLGGGP